jgi:hypothetical protein
MSKRKAGSQIDSLTPDHKKSGINLISLRAGGVWNTIGKLSTRATTFFWTLSQSEVCTKNYGAPKSQESQLWQFWDSHLGVPRQNAIWMWALWRSTEYTIRGKVVASPKSKPWWVLWVWSCPWWVLAPKVLQLCTNQLVIWFVQIWMSD